MLEFVRGYRDSLASLYAGDTSPPAAAIIPEQGVLHYVTDKGCTACHQQQTEFWERTHHAHAWQTMIDERAVSDLECITCHTVGFLKPGGFDRPDRVKGFENVQCESCHGPGSEHVSGVGFLDPDTIVSRSAAMDCEGCHNMEHSPNFKRETYVPRVACPPIDPRETMIRGIYAKAMQKTGSRLDARKHPSIPHFLSHLDICLRLEQFDEALAVADRGLELHPGAERIRIAKARALDALGRTADALALLNEAYAKDPSNEVIVHELIRLLIGGTEVAARDPVLAEQLARYAISQLDPRDLGYVKLLAQALHAQGRTEEAVETLDVYLKGPAGEFSALLELKTAFVAEQRAKAEFLNPPPLSLLPR
jgi:hypothetical protein